MEFDKGIVELMNDSLQEMVERRHSMMTDEKLTKDEKFWTEFAYLTDAINKSSEAIPKMYKVENERELEEKFKAMELNLKQKQLEEELKTKEEQHKREMQLKQKQFEEEMQMRKVEMEQKEKQFENEMEQKEKQHSEEIKQREKAEKWKTIGAFVGGCITVAGTVYVGTKTKQMEIDSVAQRLERWIPDLCNFEKTEAFTYPAGKAVERLALKM